MNLLVTRVAVRAASPAARAYCRKPRNPGARCVPPAGAGAGARAHFLPGRVRRAATAQRTLQAMDDVERMQREAPFRSPGDAGVLPSPADIWHV